MSTITATRPSPRLVNDSEKPVVNHYFKKSDMTMSIVTGEKILALCGEISNIVGNGGGETSQTTRGKLVVCEPCKSVFESVTGGIPLD